MTQESISIIALLCLSLAYCCVFPKYLQHTTWHKNIHELTRTVIYFRENIMEFQQENTKLNFISDEWEDMCYRMVDVNKFVVIHDNDTYSCIVFVRKSASVIKMMSSMTNEKFSSNLCDDLKLKLDPSLLVSFGKSQKEFQTCPFAGGYNMKLRDKGGTAHPCNSMELPMRFESECHKGEGITIDFRIDHCVWNIPMSVTQKALCVTSWRQDGDVLTILRAPDTNRLWCLRIPARRSFDGKTVMILYMDPTCNDYSDAQLYTLELELINQNSLCLDEHNACSRLPCYDYFKSQCLRSCGQCDPNVYQTACNYPRKIRGEWILNDAYGENAVNISGSQLHFDRVGSFSCITFPDSPPSRKTKQFTTVSFFSNGCRPRYTCISFKRMHSNIYGFALSQSKIWPLPNGHANVWSEICDTSNFHGDPKPIGDKFRTYNDVFKPMITKPNSISGITCPLDHSYILNATFQTGERCAGRLFKLCQKETYVRLQYDNCLLTSKNYEEFKCVSMIDSKYWEKIVLLQRENDKRDTVCIILSDLEPGRVILLPSGECDQFTWTYVNIGLRQPTLDMIVTPEIQSCRSVETTAAPVTSKASTFNTPNKPMKNAKISGRSTEFLSNKIAKTTRKDRYENHMKTTPSFPYKVVQNYDADKPIKTTESSASASSSLSLSSSFSVSAHIFFHIYSIYFTLQK